MKLRKATEELSLQTGLIDQHVAQIQTLQHSVTQLQAETSRQQQESDLRAEKQVFAALAHRTR